MSKREDKKLKQQNKKVSIGGQAVIEGVMMRGKSSMATAVRDEEGIIRLETKRLTPTEKKSVFLRLPFVRGVVSFITSMTSGTKVLMRSAEVFGEGEPSKLEKWVSEKLKINVMSVITTFSMILGLFLAVFLFMWLPQFVREQLEVLFSVKFDLWAKNFIEGGLKLLVFVSYILLASILKDIRRTFMYHGAEHKTISCYERGLELTVENAKKCTRVHDRCGTTFMVLVMVVSILVFAGVEALVGTSVENIYRVLLKIALLPVVAGISYEILKLLSKTKSVFFLPFKAPGLLLQCITTREPDDEMLEVAITAFKTVMEMDENPEIPEVEFIVPVKCNQLVEQVKEKLLEYGIDEGAEAEWIVSLTVGIKRDELVTENLVCAKNVEKINKIVEERITGRPLWYCIGDTEFYGYTIKVDERVLIPRPETEILVDKALECVNSDSKVLDLCTGSGAIAISINKESGASVTAVDISDGALALASENSKLNNAEVTFVKSDMFANLTEEKFDVIVSNPPYIKRSDLTALQKEVADFEPTIALDGGDDGLDFYRVICKTVRNHLNNGGVLLMECGFNQAQDISAMLDGFTKVEIIKDYENIDRIVKAVL